MQRIASKQRRTELVLAVTDAAFLLAAGVAAAWIRFGGEFYQHELNQILRHPGFVAYAIAMLWGLATTFDLYRPENWRTRDQLLVRMAALAASLPIALALGTYLVLEWRFGRGLLALTTFLAVPLQCAVRAAYLLVAPRPPVRSAVVIGDGPIVGALKEELERRPAPPFRLVRHLPAPSNSSPTLSTEQLEGADMVIVASLAHQGTVDRLAALNFRGTTVLDAAGAFAALTGRIPVLQVDSRWFIATGDFSSLATTPFHHLQRFLDVVAASVMLILASPLLAVAAVAVLLTSGRPVLYRQVRLGRFRKPFVLLKLRTMKNGSEPEGPVFAAENDERVNFVGRLLRRWRIDELPQLVNVLRGEMSLVGPRPERPEVAEELEHEIPFFAFRYSVRPGLTGWAQVNLPYCADTEDHLLKLEYDLYSIRHHGPAMYAMVLIRTLGALIFRPGR
jgi:lipopolysaccharide/colanic/teichoic acid biosynthesis glycosyltransferase